MPYATIGRPGWAFTSAMYHFPAFHLNTWALIRGFTVVTPSPAPSCPVMKKYMLDCTVTGAATGVHGEAIVGRSFIGGSLSTCGQRYVGLYITTRTWYWYS